MNVFETIIREISEQIKSDIQSEFVKGERHLLKVVTEAYNYYDESEHDGVDYLFSIDNTDDVICCLNGGMSVKEVSELYNLVTIRERLYNDRAPYFFFGVNYDNAYKTIPRTINLVKFLCSTLNEVVENMLAYPTACEAYEVLYETYVSKSILERIK